MSVPVQENNEKNQSLTVQGQLFQIGVSEKSHYGNLMNHYDSLPHWCNGKHAKVPAAQNTDSDRVRSHSFILDDTAYTLEISPTAGKRNGEEYDFYPGTPEENVFAALMKLAGEKLEQYGNRIGVPFTLSELARRISDDHQKMSLTNIKESLSILKKADYTLRRVGEDGKLKEWEYTHINEILSSGERDNPNDGDQFFAVFNSMITEEIAKLQYRLYNHSRFKKFKGSLTRLLYKKLCNEFRWAATGRMFEIFLMETRDWGQLNTPEDMKINKRRDPLIFSFDELIELGVLESYRLLRVIKETGSNGRKRTVDEVYEVYPTQEFVNEIKKANAVKNERELKFRMIQDFDLADRETTDPELQAVINMPAKQANALYQKQRHEDEAEKAAIEASELEDNSLPKTAPGVQYTKVDDDIFGSSAP
ncbi:hypothetical protein [Neptuniibacter sp. QD37_11]|uniref:hypothetical protein n=1 Tax=Neptuniibacter sp. QD37_11 TaxID=3398209 RepID=UPI0039F4A2C2